MDESITTPAKFATGFEESPADNASVVGRTIVQSQEKALVKNKSADQLPEWLDNVRVLTQGLQDLNSSIKKARMTKRQYNFRQTIKEQKAFISREKAILKDARDKICQSVSVTKLPNLTKVSHVPKVAPLAADWTAEMSYQTPN